MRLAAQMRGGYYPAPPEAVALAATLLEPPARETFTILDPCAGEGAAIRQLGELLGALPTQMFAIELDESRASTLHAALPESHVLAPASFFGCRASYSSFSLTWLNPPFDQAYGGYRVEDQFLRMATDWLMPTGVMAFVCPENVMDEYSDAREHFASYYENCKIVAFPEKYRRFHEIIVFGQKRARPKADSGDYTSWESVQAPDGFVYRIPPGAGPRLFRKVEPTERELQRLFADSPLRAHLNTAPTASLPSPPLALGIGHVALLLASGHLDGIVHPEDQPPHVVRGSSRKREYVSDVTETSDDESTIRTTTLSERIELMVRTVDLTGHIQTLLESDAQEAASKPEPKQRRGSHALIAGRVAS
jgi:hypothetical protein